METGLESQACEPIKIYDNKYLDDFRRVKKGFEKNFHDVEFGARTISFYRDGEKLVQTSYDKLKILSEKVYNINMNVVRINTCCVSGIFSRLEKPVT